VTRLPNRGALGAALLLAGGAWLGAAHARDAGSPCAPWPEWQRFEQFYLSDDGRVIDAGARQGITVSEGQAYALTFALIANDRPAFERILKWTQDNLAGGHLELALPAWKWGRADDGRWTALDPNSAADADVWIVYALGEAARLWHETRYDHLAQAMAELIVREEVAWIPQLGATLLPGPKGFVSQQTWRLNASYSPIQALEAIGGRSGDRLWGDLLQSSTRVIVGSAPHGYAADWIDYRPPDGFITDSSTHGGGGYDSIRVYLWAGMLADADRRSAALTRKLEPMAELAAEHLPPEWIDTNTLEMHGAAPAGFLAALLPLLSHFHHPEVVESYRRLVQAAALQDNRHYYSDVLSLFGLGWVDGRYRFDRQGRLQVRWNASCGAP
jgi:endoglucanase